LRDGASFFYAGLLDVIYRSRPAKHELRVLSLQMCY
jgi:hypothetical protein